MPPPFRPYRHEVVHSSSFFGRSVHTWTFTSSCTFKYTILSLPTILQFCLINASLHFCRISGKIPLDKQWLLSDAELTIYIKWKQIHPPYHIIPHRILWSEWICPWYRQNLPPHTISEGQISVLWLATTISADQAMYGSSSFIQSDFSIPVRAHGSVRILQFHPIRFQHFRTCPWERTDPPVSSSQISAFLYVPMGQRTDPPVSSNQIIGYIYHVMVISVCCPCILPHECVFSLDLRVSGEYGLMGEDTGQHTEITMT